MSVGKDIIKMRRVARETPALANANISEDMLPQSIATMQLEVAEKCCELLEVLGIDTASDHNTAETGARMAKMFVQEVFAGRYTPRPKLTFFPNTRSLDEIYAVGPITVRSCCSHHFAPIIGQCWIGLLPGDRVIGLSKFNRLVEWVMARPQIQEEATIMLADEIEEACQPRGLGVVVRATHHCMCWRGVKDAATVMTTSVMRKAFRDVPAARAELMTIIRGMGF